MITDFKIFFDIYNNLVDSYKDIIRESKKILSKENNYIYELSFKIYACFFAIDYQIKKDFRKYNFGFDSGYFDPNKDFLEFYDKEKVDSIYNKIRNNYKKKNISRIDELAVNLSVEKKLYKLKPIYNYDNKIVIGESMEEEVNEYINIRSEYNIFIKNFLHNLLKCFYENVDSIRHLQEITFKELERIVNKNRNISINEIKIIKSIEDYLFVKNYLERLLGILYEKNHKIKIYNLSFFRKKSSYKFNTLCHRCNRKLNKKNSFLYCSSKDNTICYKNRSKNILQTEFNSNCPNCKKKIGKNFVLHKHNDNKLLFCSKQCYQSLRKKEYREKNIKYSQ